MIWIGIVIGAISASFGWWMYVRSIGGVISDLKDAAKDAKKL